MIGHLKAENESLQERLAAYEMMLDSRNRKIQELQEKLSQADAVRSNMDIQQEEMELLQSYVASLQSQVSGHASGILDIYDREDIAATVEHQLEDLQKQSVYFQSQIEDLQLQMTELNNRNLLLSHQSGQLAELESLIAIIEEERDHWKAIASAHQRES